MVHVFIFIEILKQIISMHYPISEMAYGLIKPSQNHKSFSNDLKFLKWDKYFLAINLTASYVKCITIGVIFEKGFMLTNKVIERNV